jgi:uncharacterized protein (TIGR02466 family)
MNREDWFVTPIWVDQVELDYQAVANFCLQLKQSSFPNRILSNIGGWQSDDINLNDYSELTVIKSIIDQRIIGISEEISPSLRLELDNAWININGYGDRNMPHVHPVTAMSGTLYIQVDDSTGKIIFHNDQYTLKHYPFIVEDSPLFFRNVFYTPKRGMMIIFPAWIPHEVESNKSSLTRISISFNIRQKRK